MMREFGKKTGCTVYDVGEGVCHQLIPEAGPRGAGRPHGRLRLATRAPTVRSTSSRPAWAPPTERPRWPAGKLWFKVPETMKVVYNGELQPGVFSKDLILYLAGQIGVDGATYMALEFHGPVIDALSVEARMTISNMAIEVGAKTGLMEADEKTLAWFEGRGDKMPAPVVAGCRCRSTRSAHEIDASEIGPQIAKPHAVDNVSPIEEVEGTPIAQGVIGTCTNGRLEDLRDRRRASSTAARSIRMRVSSSRRPRGRSTWTRWRPATSRRSSRQAQQW